MQVIRLLLQLLQLLLRLQGCCPLTVYVTFTGALATLLVSLPLSEHGVGRLQIIPHVAI